MCLFIYVFTYVFIMYLLLCLPLYTILYLRHILIT
jgi:hypothetical protein